MKKYLMFIVLLYTQLLFGQDNSNWGFVGPSVVTNNSNGNYITATGFNPERVSCIAYDSRAGYQSKYYAGSIGGIWMSNNAAASWQPMDPNNTMCYGGASAMAVDPLNGDVYMASTGIVQSVPASSLINTLVMGYSSIYRLQNPFGTQIWSTLTAFPVACVVHNIKFNPGNDSYLYACTSQGLFLSINKGTSWTTVTNTETYDIAFVPDGSTTYCFASGSSIFLKSTDGINFTHVTAVETDITNTTSSTSGNNAWTYTLADICVGDLSTSTKYMYLLEWASNSTLGLYEVYQITENAGNVTCPNGETPYIVPELGYSGNNQYDEGGPDRLALGYVQSNGLLFCGGIGLYGYDTKNNVVTSAYMYHSDNHYILDVPSATTVLDASDGGICAYNYSTYTYPYGYPSFSLSSIGLNIAQVDGLSGAETESDNDLYVIGDQDALNGWSYKVSANQSLSTGGSTEPSGGIIDKFNDNTIIMNSTSYSSGYDVSTTGTGPSAFSSALIDPCGSTSWQWGTNPYLPVSGSTFEADETSAVCQVGNFAKNSFFQDPSRPDKIYYGTSYLSQWDPTQNVFALKIAPTDVFSNLDWFCTVISGAISPINKNGFYFTTNCRYFPAAPEQEMSQIIQFIGPNIDDSWWQHNENTSNWAEITPNLNNITFPASYGFTTLTAADQFNFAYLNVVVSTWNPNKIWVICSSIPHNPYVKVLEYDNGTWTDYSLGLPSTEVARSLVMEIGSNDGMYLGTDRAVYYRNATMSSWQTFDNNIPHVGMNQLEVNYNENTLRAGTYGRGIWKSSLQCPSTATLTLANTTNNEFDEVTQSITSTANVTTYTIAPDNAESMVYYRAGQDVLLNQGFYAVPASNFTAFIHPCSGTGNSFLATAVGKDEPTNDNIADMDDAVKSIQENDFNIQVFPNPNTGNFVIRLPEGATSDVHIYNLLGTEVYSKTQLTEQIEVDFSNQANGMYFIKAIDDKTGKTDVKKVMIKK